MSEIVRMIPKASDREALNAIWAHLDASDRLLVETSDLKEVRYQEDQSIVTIVMEFPVRLGPESVTKIELAALKAIPGMTVKIEQIVPEPMPVLSIETDWGAIISSVKKMKPTAGPWLIVSQASLVDGKLTVLCADALAATRLREMKCDKAFQQCMGNEMPVTFSDGALTLPAPAPPKIEIPKNNDRIFLGGAISGKVTKIQDIVAPMRRVIIEGQILGIDLREGHRTRISMIATDYTDSIRVKLAEPPASLLLLKNGDNVRISGRIEPDKFENEELTMTPTDIVMIPTAIKMDNADEKRVELNLHSKFSRLNGMIEIEALFERIKLWGWSGFAITDNAVVQSFPKVYAAAKKAGLKAGLGCQINYVDDRKPIAWNFNPKKKKSLDLSQSTVVFDLETTGLGAISNKVIEIAAFRIEKNMIVDEFKTLVNPGEPLNALTRELTHISDEMLIDAPDWKKALADFRAFSGDALLVAHNISFDSGFLRRDWPEDAPFPALLDTLGLARALIRGVRNYTLGTIAKTLSIPLLDAHRAADDARALAKIYIELRARLKERGIERLDQLDSLLPEIEAKKIPSQDVVLLVQSTTGLKNLYKLVSNAHMTHLYMRPRTPASLLESCREGLLAGSGAIDGPVVNALMSGEDPHVIDELAKRFDYLEIGPPSIYAEKCTSSFLRSPEEVRGIISEMIQIGLRAGRPVIGVSQAHHLDEREHKYRKILKSPKSENIPSLHLRTTDEMLEEFDFLGPDVAREIVIDAPKRLLGSLDDVSPLPKGFFPPVIEGAAEELRELTMRRAQEVYGGSLPKEVTDSIEKELNAIIGNGFSVLYLIAMRLCHTSRESGFVVGSRGSVGSSLVAFLTGITEVNPLPPHYRCNLCFKTVFEPAAACGPDLAEKTCCGAPMQRDGYRIPFEAFMGIDGTKVPDIDLNFAGEYQPRAMAQIEEEFGKDNVFRAGTISTLQPKTAAFIVGKYLEEHAIKWRRAEVERYAHGLTQISRTTGQHPGGIVIIPRGMEITDFMPIQRPADSEDADTITTHFDFHSYEGTIVKVDVLGHEGPTAVRKLFEMTGIDPMTVPINDPDVLSLFSSPKALGLTEAKLGCPVGTLGIPEFGTPLLLTILAETRPTTVEELVRISGLSHGKGVWKGNAQDLIRNGSAKLSDVIATREDIMNELVKRDMDPVQAFAIMERVRKGKGLAPENEALMKRHKIPSWVVASCQKILYMFPRAHAVAYVLMALRIAWYKVHRPEAFYAMWLTLKVADFDLETAIQGDKAVSRTITEIKKKMGSRSATKKEEDNVVVFEIVREMNARGISVLPIRLGVSDVLSFVVDGKAVRAPLLSVSGLGEKVARKLASELAAGGIDTIEDLVRRTGLSKPLVERLRGYGAFGDLPETNQLALF